MQALVDNADRIVVLAPRGRLDAFRAKELQAEVEARLDAARFLVLDMAAVDYLSSAALRVVVAAQARLAAGGGGVALAALQPYCRGVLEITGLAAALPVFDTTEAAAEHCRAALREAAGLAGWDALESRVLPGGTFRFLPGSEDPGAISVLGHIEDVLYARVTPERVCDKRFSETEYSIGLGGLGDRPDDYFPLMGEMITIGGTMVWLPTDGNDTPDFLIPREDSTAVTLRTAFNVAIAGEFNELVFFESREADGTTMTGLYRMLFDLAAARRPDFRGLLGLSMRAEMASVFGSGVRKSPVAPFAPADGEMITHPRHFEEWFEFDTAPRHRDVTGLVAGLGADLTRDLSVYDPGALGAVFYLNPANRGSATELLHNHAVIFAPLPMPERPASLEREIRSVVDRGDFIDMRHLLDRSAVRRALIGLSYTQAVRREAPA
jgi:anti-anti-sigma factor